MGLKRGFVTVVNVHASYWSSKIQASAASVKGLMSNQCSRPAL